MKKTLVCGLLAYIFGIICLVGGFNQHGLIEARMLVGIVATLVLFVAFFRYLRIWWAAISFFWAGVMVMAIMVYRVAEHHDSGPWGVVGALAIWFLGGVFHFYEQDRRRNLFPIE
jgi:hypothetical protein